MSDQWDDDDIPPPPGGWPPTGPWTDQDTANAEVRDLARQPPPPDQPYPDLSTTSDPDWLSFQSGDPAWFLRAAGRAVRKYCGWHIYPNIRETIRNRDIGSWGIVMLPSRYVTGVDRFVLKSGKDHEIFVPRDDYEWHQSGWIQRKGWGRWSWYAENYFYGNDQYYLPANPGAIGIADVTFWHGYSSCPADVKEVLFELTQSIMIMPSSGNIKNMEVSGGYRLELAQDFGLTLNQDQRNRLADYRIGMIA